MPAEPQEIAFESEPGFCANCGTILPYLGSTGPVTCFICKSVFGPDAFGAMEAHYVIHFNSRDAYKEEEEKTSEGKKGDSAEGPIVERRCPKCGNEKMSYATLQLRSADEGQTVFYTCTKCKFKETENS